MLRCKDSKTGRRCRGRGRDMVTTGDATVRTASGYKENRNIPMCTMLDRSRHAIASERDEKGKTARMAYTAYVNHSTQVAHITVTPLTLLSASFQGRANKALPSAIGRGKTALATHMQVLI